MTLTQEQQNIITALETHPIVCVSAKAGTGKTSTSLAIVAHFQPKKGLYTAYNKSIVQEAQEKFPSSVLCKTTHAFALRYVSPKKRIEDFTYNCIKEKLSYTDKRIVIDTMQAFFLSASVDMAAFFTCIDPKLAEITIKYIYKMLEEEINPTFDFLLKYLHLQLAQDLITIELDLLILDECQDTTAVSFEIFKLITAKRKLIVGDPHQNIYGYLNTVNAFNLITNVPFLPLTTTFRCSPSVAALIQEFGDTHLEKNFHYTGIGTNVLDPSIAYIARTNGGVLMRIDQLLEEGETFTLTKPIKELLALPMALSNVVAGREVYHKQYKYLEKEYKNYAISGEPGFFKYLKLNVDDEELHSSINFMNQLNKKKINIFKLKEQVEAMKPNPNIYVVTCHSFKGREVGTVYIESDLNLSTRKAIRIQDTQELNLSYVAMSRAKHTLVNCDFMKEDLEDF